MFKNIQYKNIFKILFVIIFNTSVYRASFLKNFEKSKKDISSLKEKASKVKNKVNQKKDSVKNKFDEAKGKIDEAKGKVDEFKGKFEESKGRIDEAKGKFDEAKGRVDEFKGKFEEAKGKIDEAKGKLDEAKGEVSDLNGGYKEKFKNEKNKKKDDNNIKKTNIDDRKDNLSDKRAEMDIKNFPRSSLSSINEKKYFIISADVVSDFPNGQNSYKDLINPIQQFNKISLKNLILENKFLLIFLIFLVTILVLSFLVLGYFFIKNKPLEIIISGLFSCFYLINTIDCILILSQNHLYANECIEVLHCFILSIIFVIMGFSLGIFVMKEYASKRKLP